MASESKVPVSPSDVDQIRSLLEEMKLSGGGGTNNDVNQDQEAVAVSPCSSSRTLTPGGDSMLLEKSDSGDFEIIEPCKLKELLPHLPLPSVMGSKFLIVHHCRPKFTEFQVMTTDVFQNDFFHLKECIFDVVESDAKLEENPEVDDIVLAPPVVGKGKVYHRAVIVSIPEENPYKIGVYFFDVGGFQIVDVSKLKPVTKEIMEFPMLGYPVMLQGFGSADCNLEQERILVTDYNSLMEKFKSVTYRLEYVGETEKDLNLNMDEKFKKYDVHLHFNPRQVEMDTKGEHKLADQIKRLGQWQWEKTIRGFPGVSWNDDQLLNEKTMMETDIQLYSLEIGSIFSAQVTQVISGGERKTRTGTETEANLRIILLDDPVYVNHHTVLNDQIERYCQLVRKSRFFPAINEHSLIKVDDLEWYANYGIASLGKWSRAIRMDADSFYLYDWDDTIRLEDFDSADYDVRRLHWELRAFESLVINLCPLDNGRPMTCEMAAHLFKPFNRYSFKIVRSRSDHLFEAECMPNWQNLKEDPCDDEIHEAEA